MADNVAITAGSGTAIATDDVSGVHYQRMKLVDGALDGTDAIPGSAARGMTVDPRPFIQSFVQTPTVSTTPAYTAKDAIGGLLTFASVARDSGGAFTLRSVMITDKAQQMSDLDLILFNATIAAPTDNAVFAPTDAEALTIIGVVPIGAGHYADLSTNSVAVRHDLQISGVLAGTSLFGVLVARGTPTYAATSDIVVTLGIERH